MFLVKGIYTALYLIASLTAFNHKLYVIALIMLSISVVSLFSKWNKNVTH